MMFAFSLLAPSRLLLALVPLAIVALYVVMQLRKPRDVARFTNLALLDEIVPKRSSWRRHLPLIPLVLGMLALVVALARPFGETPEGVGATMVVAIDVSLSMEATDVQPSRIAAAQKAATDLINGAPAGLRIGLIAFAGSPRVLVNPTSDKGELRGAVNGLQLGRGTAIGEAIFTGLDVLNREIKLQDKKAASLPAGTTTTAPAVDGSGNGQAAVDQLLRKSVRLVVMSDGKTTAGRPNEDATASAKDDHIAVDTIAFGTATGKLTVQGETVAVPVEPGPLQDIATTTGGQFYETASADTLAQVFKQISGSLGSRTVRKEIPMPFVFTGFVLFSVAVAGALLLGQRFP